MGRSIINWGGVTNDTLIPDSDYPLSTKAAVAEFLRLQNLLIQKETELKSLITQTDTELSSVKQSVATATSFGLAKITTAMSITDGNSGIALSAIHNNGTITGSLRNMIDSAHQNIADLRTLMNKFKFNTFVGTPNSDIAIIQDNAATSSSFAIVCNGDYNARMSTHVMGIQCKSNEIHVKLNEVVTSPIRLNYIIMRQ